MNLDSKLQQAASTAVDHVATHVRGVKAVVISTEDGFEVASRTANTANTGRLSALASSMAALGAIAGQESNLGACSKVMVETTDGLIVMVQAARADVSLVLSVMAGSDAILGQLVYFAGEASRALEAA